VVLCFKIYTILASDAQWINIIDLFFPQFRKKFYSIIVAVAK